MKKAIVTFGTGPHAEYLDIARPSFKAYASLHGYDYFEAQNIGTARPAPWYKLKAMGSLLKAEYEAVVFLGADTLIVDGREDVLDSFHPDNWQAMVQHRTQDGNVPNTDMWIVTPPMIEWLEKAWALDKYLHHGWWEQAALLELMGYQLYPCEQISASNLTYHTQFLDASWNVHIKDTNQTNHLRIQHATQWPDRPAIMREWAKQAEGWTECQKQL